MNKSKEYHLGEEVPLRWDHGPVSFGLVLSGSVVSWSDPEARDLLIGRCWQGIFLYPSRELSEEELARPPVQVFPSTLGDVHAVPVDWSRDGTGDLIACNRNGFLYQLKRQGTYPDLSFELHGPARDNESGLCINIPYENPHHPVLDDLGGYFDRAFYNYIYPIVYPGREDGALDLIVGDWAGNLWWLPDVSGGIGAAEYRGIPYRKREEDTPTKRGKEFVGRYGQSYAKPQARICDEAGEPFLLGTGSDTGGLRYPGGNTRPVVYRNRQTGTHDLLVLAGTVGNTIFYLQRVDTGSSGEPVFRNMGSVPLLGLDSESGEILGFHSKLIPGAGQTGDDLMISLGARLAVFHRRSTDDIKPVFELNHIISAPDAMAGCNNISRVLKGTQGKRFTLESWGNQFDCREIIGPPERMRLAAKAVPLRDQSGVFRVEGETDPQGGADWGFHRAGGWDFDGSGKQHLVVGTDKGLLYLLMELEADDANSPPHYRSHGPLVNSRGEVIRIHNRAVAAGYDVDGDGKEDLVVGGCSYQAGIAGDPTPGGGVYLLRHRGLDEEGIPVLEGPEPLEVDGFTYNRAHTNAHVFLQTEDVDNDGKKELLLAIQWHDGGRMHVLKKPPGGTGLADCGTIIPQSHPIQEWVLDLDGDGELELTFSGSENGVGFYRKLNRE
jgi:hypothetical protein